MLCASSSIFCSSLLIALPTSVKTPHPLDNGRGNLITQRAKVMVDT
jgi:hypothetical protein